MTRIAMKIRPLLLSLLAFMVPLQAELPKDYIIKEGTISPDGRYGILILGREEALNLDAGSKSGGQSDDRLEANYLADLKEKKALTSFEGIYEGENHCWMDAEWADNVSWCLAKYGFRWGYDRFTLIQIHEGKKPVVAELCATVTQTVGDDFSWGIGEPWIAADTDEKLFHFSLLANDNPHGLDSKKTHFKAFIGRYDLVQGKWIFAKAAAISEEERNALDYYGFRSRGNSETSEQWHRRMDDQLNTVYALLKRRQKPDVFARLRAQQREWVAGSDKSGSLLKENVRLAKRLHELRDYAMIALVGE